MLKAYASYFVSFLLNNLKDIINIDKIILFGSVARGDATKESDIDIFVEVKRKSNILDKKINNILNEFYKSREALMFRSKGIENKINLIIGRLDEWIKLKKSIESTGIVLYGKYYYSGKGEKKYAIIFWDEIKKNRGAFLNKLYGFRIGKKRYSGFLEKFGGRKLGKSNVMMPIEYRDDILKLIKSYKVNARIIEVYE